MIRGISPILTLACLLGALGTQAQMDEYSIKAGYLYNFSKYVVWPTGAFASAESSFAICVVGQDPFGRRLDEAISGKTSGDSRPLELRRFNDLDISAARGCQIVFLNKSEARHSATIVDALRNLPIFTVADFPSFAEAGGIADLRIEGTRVKVDLNMNAADHANLKVSGKLQQVARAVN